MLSLKARKGNPRRFFLPLRAKKIYRTSRKDGFIMKKTTIMLATINDVKNFVSEVMLCDYDVDLTVFLLSLTRIMLPHALIPATTALGTASGTGRERGILAGANVIMPNLSPMSVRKKYMLYDGKISTGSESADALKDLAERMESIGYHIDLSRGDHK